MPRRKATHHPPSLLPNLDDEDRRSGIIDAIIGDGELLIFLGLLARARQSASDSDRTHFIVRSGTALLITSTPPTATKDIDALYILEIRPRDLSGTRENALLTSITRAIMRFNMSDPT